MRSRTEMVTTQLEGSDFDDESDFEDSEEDWQPAKGEQKPKKVKSPGRASKKSSPTGKNGAKKRARKPVARKPKKKPSSDEEEPEVSEAEEFSDPEPEPVSSPPKKVKPSPKKVPAEEDGGHTSVTPVSIIKSEPTTSSPASKPVPLQRKVVTQLKSFPDKFGFLNLYIFKGDLKEGIINNPQVCLWRRDGSSLLQKYLRDKTIDTDLPQFNSSMVYSCWEDKRANEYIEVKVRCIEQSKQVRVELTNVDELEAQSQAEYEGYVAEHGVPEHRSGTAGDSQEGTEDDDEVYEHDEEDEEAEESEAEEE